MNEQTKIQSQVEEHPMATWLSEDTGLGMPESGEVRQGEVVANFDNNVMVDIGAKSEAIIIPSEIAKMDAGTKAGLAVGNTVSVFILDPDSGEGEILVSYTKALEMEDWIKAEELLESGEVYEGEVIGFNRGGLLTKMGQLRGFVPASQLINNRRLRNSDNAESFLKEFVGNAIAAKIIEVDQERNRLILSERAAQKEVRAAKRAEMIQQITKGDILDGEIVNLADFGAFVDIGGVEGLVHISEMSWKRNVKASELIDIGDKVKVYVLNIDEEKQRIALSLKRLENDPWSTVTDRYHVGQLVSVLITKLADYGAFARITGDEYGFEGLIHISELSFEHVTHPSQLLKRGDEITARIIRIAPDKKQIGLSLKQVTSEKYMDADMAWAEANPTSDAEEE